MNKIFLLGFSILLSSCELVDYTVRYNLEKIDFPQVFPKKKQVFIIEIESSSSQKWFYLNDNSKELRKYLEEKTKDGYKIFRDEKDVKEGYSPVITIKK